MTPGLVIDTSAVLAVLLHEPTRPVLITATEGCGLVGAPSLPSEVGNALVAGFRRKRLAVEADRKSTRLNSSHIQKSRMPSSA